MRFPFQVHDREIFISGADIKVAFNTIGAVFIIGSEEETIRPKLGLLASGMRPLRFVEGINFAFGRAPTEHRSSNHAKGVTLLTISPG